MKKRHIAETVEPTTDFLGRPEAHSNSKLFPLFWLGGLLLPVLSSAFCAIHYIGFPNAPTPVFPYILLPVGLLSAVIGQRVSRDKWEGGVMEVLHTRLAYGALAYVAIAVKYILAGRTVERYPAGLLAVISGIIVTSRVVIKFRTNIFAWVQNFVDGRQLSVNRQEGRAQRDESQDV